jgi:hypothetical protein
MATKAKEMPLQSSIAPLAAPAVSAANLQQNG